MIKRLIQTVLGLSAVCGLLVSSLGYVSIGSSSSASNDMSIACATGFSRLAPHYCGITGDISGGSYTVGTYTMDNTCRNFDLSAIIPASATMVHLVARTVIHSTNAVGQKQALVFYTTPACGNSRFYFSSIREMTAVAANTILYEHWAEHHAPIVSQILYYKASVVGGATTGINSFIIGYYD